MWRTAVGIGILAVLGNAFDRLQVDTFWQTVIKGGIIVFAIAVDSYSGRRSEALERGERARQVERRHVPRYAVNRMRASDMVLYKGNRVGKEL